MIAASHLPQEHEGGGDVGDSDGMQTGNAGGEGVPPPPPSTEQSSAGATIPITASFTTSPAGLSIAPRKH